MSASGSFRSGGVLAVGFRRLALAVLAPLVVLAVAEGVLRVVGFGEPTSYFLPAEGDPALRVENPAFGRRFFPPGLLRVPPPARFPARKAPGTRRILVFGESAVMGDPKPAYGVARYLEVLLRDRYPGGKFEVIPVAMTAINGHALRPMARESAALGADDWIVFAGNNEMLGPYGAGSVLGRRTPPWPLVRLVLAAKSTRLGQGIEALAASWRQGPVGSSQWAGLRGLSGDPVAGDAPARRRVHAAFERNLRDMVRLGRSAGARVYLSTVAVNLRDSAPFGSEHRGDLTPEDRAQWDRLFEAGRQALDAGEAGRALEALDEALKQDDRPAALHFVLGRAWLAQTNLAEAAAAFRRACDLDTLPFRADGVLNKIVAEVALSEGAGLIDAVQGMNAGARGGIAGGEFFYEHVHLTPEGNHTLARLFGDALASDLTEAERAGDRGAWATQETCDTRLVLTPWARSQSADLMLARCLDEPFTRRLNSEEQIRALAAESARQRRAQGPEAAELVRELYKEAAAAAPEDFLVHRAHAEFLDAIGDLAGAADAWNRVRSLLPHHPVAYLQAGGLLRRLGRLDEARPLVERAVAMQPDWFEAHLELGELCLKRGRPQEAVAAFRDALRLRPTHARGHLRLADALAADRQGEAAIQSLEEAVRLDPNLWEARYFLGVEYALKEQIESAREQFAEVVRLQPGHGRAQFNLGIALARQTRWAEAAEHLAQAIRLDPANAEARRALSQVRALRQRTEAAAPGVEPGTIATNVVPGLPSPSVTPAEP